MGVVEFVLRLKKVHSYDPCLLKKNRIGQNCLRYSY